MVHAKKSLGQNFLTAKGVVTDIVKIADIVVGEQVLEIGPGKGILTTALLHAGAMVIAVEKDANLFELLCKKFRTEIGTGQLNLLCDDVLKLRTENLKLKTASYKLVANIPYNITGEILRLFIGGLKKPSHAVLLVQKEVAERIVARDGKESILSMSIKIYGTPKYTKKVPSRYFNPAPKVDSAILLIEDLRNPFKNTQEENRFFEIVKKGFAHKRKMLAGNLTPILGKERTAKLFAVYGIPEKSRAENLKLENWLSLARHTETR